MQNNKTVFLIKDGFLTNQNVHKALGAGEVFEILSDGDD